MHGRKRLWEIRLQITLKRAIEGKIFVGVEQDKYHYPGWVQFQLGNTVAATLRRLVGSLHQSPGDDPERSRHLSELERPQLAFPMEMFMDQLDITPDGDTPPDVCSADFPEMGIIKSQDRKAFKRAMSELSLEPGPTYTFGMWAPSQSIDAIKWSAMGKDVRNFGIDPPCYFMMYALKPSPPGVKETRHLDSRKDYLWHSVFWSTVLPAEINRQRELCDPVADSTNGHTTQDNTRIADLQHVRHNGNRRRFCCG